jgi:hypothetical protein
VSLSLRLFSFASPAKNKIIVVCPYVLRLAFCAWRSVHCVERFSSDMGATCSRSEGAGGTMTRAACARHLKTRGGALIVSAYYCIPSKRPHAFYLPNVARFLSTVRGPLVFFTSADLVDTFAAMRPEALRSMTRFEVLPVADWDAWRFKDGRAFWKRQIARDAEHYHTPELAAVWFMKHKFVLRAARAMALAEDAPVVWCDAGALRADAWADAAAQLSTHAGAHVRAPASAPDSASVWVGSLERSHAALHAALHAQAATRRGGALCPKTPPPPFRAWPHVHLAGAVLGGTRGAWTRFEAAYARTLAKYDDAAVSGSSDQYVMSTLGQLEPGVLHLVAVDARAVACVDEWFGLLAVLAAPRSNRTNS